MSCDRFQKYDRGKIAENKFRQHLETCSDCQKSVVEDEKLLSQAKFLKKQLEAPSLWTRIERNLVDEMHRRQSKGRMILFQKRWMLYPASALVVFLLGSGLFFLLRPGIKGQDLLADSALRRIERRETRYERSIQKLEIDARPQLADLDFELLLLYKDRLATIDDQIAQCKEALSTNSGNAHIRRYMLAAFQDKKDTLREILRTSELEIQRRNLE
jgi:hypothetical protein